MGHPWEKYYSDAARNFDLADMGPQTLSALVDHAADTHGDRARFTTILPNGAEGSITFRQFREHVDAFAKYLREVAGLKTGETVAVMTPNCIGFTIAAMGAARAGCKLTNVNPLYTAPELEHQLNDSEARVLVIIDMFGDKADEVVSKTQVNHVITLSVVDFFPPLKKALLNFVLKRVRKVVPVMRTPHVRLMDALAQGAAQRVDVAAYAADVSPTDTVLLQYTSGTTGRSKGAELHHQGILANAYQGELMTDHLRQEGGETTLIALPLYHITAFTLIFVAALRTGGHSLLLPSPRPPSNLQKPLEKYKVTWFTGINTLFAALLAEPWFKREHFEHVRFCGSGGAAQQTGVAQKWKDATGVEINQGYGMTEVHGVLTLNPPQDNRLGKVGIPVPGMELRLVGDNGQDVELGQPGEVLYRGPTQMHGYYKRPDANEDSFVDGWLRSGDIGVMDEDGFLEIVDRKKDMILVSGFNVSPNEIEDVISTVPGVVQVGVIGIPDEKTSETPAAFVVRSDDSVTEETIMAACKTALTNYKRPHRIEFVDEVPVTLSGKVLRRELRDKYLNA